MRLSIAFLLAIIINGLLFMAMQYMIKSRQITIKPIENVQFIDFIRSPNQTQPHPKQRIRQLPPEPPPPPQQPQQKPIKNTLSKPSPLPVPRINVTMPTIKDIDIGQPYVGSVETTSTQQNTTPQPIGLNFVTAQDLIAIRRRQPTYPRRLKRRKIEGYVVLEFIINTKGRVIKPTVIESKPTGAFDKAALKAVRRWQFRPQREAGTAISVRTRQRIDFKLQK